MSNIWYYADKTGQVGPLSLRDLRRTLSTLGSLQDVFVWCDRFPDWKLVEDVPEVRELVASRAAPPPLPNHVASGDIKRRALEKALKPKEVPVIGIVATGLGLASAMMPYFAAVFFVPAALICGIIAVGKQQVRWGILAIILSLVGLGAIIYTSQQITSIFTDKPGRISLPQPAFAPPPIVTQAQYDRILNGMSYQQVRNIIGTGGEELSRSDIAGMTTVMYSWTNSNGSNMNAMFQNGRLVNKAQFGLR